MSASLGSRIAMFPSIGSFGFTIVALLSLVVLPGCAQETAPPAEPEIPVHFTTYTDETSLFSIAYPRDWELALSQIEGLKQRTEELLQSIESGFSMENAGFLFIAGQPNDEGYDPNVTIVVESLPGIGWTHDRMVEAEVEGMKRLAQGFREISRIKTMVDQREMTLLEAEITWQGVGTFRQLQGYMLEGNVAWAITCTTLPEAFDGFRSDADSIVRSFRILK